MKRETVLIKVFGLTLYLNKKEWEKIMIGLSPKKPGRLTLALYYFLLLMFSNKDVRLLIGSGASEKDGLKEAEWIKKYLIKNEVRIRKSFSIFNNIPLSLESDINKAWTDNKSKNTYEEAAEAGRRAKMIGANTVYLVSDSAHIWRCGRDFYVFLENQGWLDSSIKIVIIPSYLPYQRNINIYINERRKGEEFNPNFS